MPKSGVILCAFVLLACLAGNASAFQEYPSLELEPYVGFIFYDPDLTMLMSNLCYGVRLELRTMEYVGFQFNYAISTLNADIPSFPIGQDNYVHRIQFNLTRDVWLTRGFFLYLYGGVGIWGQTLEDAYTSDFSMQAGLGARRNIVRDWYFRTDAGWTGAYNGKNIPDSPKNLTNNFEFSLSIAYLFDN